MQSRPEIVECWRQLVRTTEVDRTLKIDLLHKLLRESGDCHSVYQVSELNVIELIGTMERPTCTRMAERLSMTRGAISKIATRLIAHGDVERYQQVGDDKQVFFRLTHTGEIVCAFQRKLHQQMDNTLAMLFSRYNDAELRLIAQLFDEIRTSITHFNNTFRGANTDVY